MSSTNFSAVVPAAGLGTRMKSKNPKFLHKLAGRTIISHILYSLNPVVDEIVVVVGNGKELVEKEIKSTCEPFFDKIVFVEQGELLGSGHAVKMGLTGLSSEAENVMVVLGDTPLLDALVLTEMRDLFKSKNCDVLVSTAHLEDPFGYGRIVRDENEIIKQIVEEKDCDDAQKTIDECNMYPFVFKREFLEVALDKLDTNNAQGEQYLTDVVTIARESSKGVGSYTYINAHVARGVNDREQLAELEKIMRDTINAEHMKNGVTMIDPATTYIDAEVTIENDVTILPGTMISGKSVIGSGCIIGPNTRIIDSTIGGNCEIESSTIKNSTLENDVTVGPYVSLRQGALLRSGVHVGTFVEIKKSDIGKGTKVPHLSYLGDATVGENTNLGAGTTTANYDGKDKHPTKIGNNVKTGVNTVLVAPVEIEDDAYTAAGAVVVEDVPTGALAKGVPARNDQEWVPPKDR